MSRKIRFFLSAGLIVIQVAIPVLTAAPHVASAAALPAAPLTSVLPAWAIAGDADPLVVWTPVAAYDIAPCEVLTLTFRMTTDGDAVSGQRLDVNAVYENPLSDPGSTNGGVNVTLRPWLYSLYLPVVEKHHSGG